MSSSRQQEGTVDNTEYNTQVTDTFEDADEGMQQPTSETTRYENVDEGMQQPTSETTRYNDPNRLPVEAYLVNGVKLENGKKVTYVGGSFTEPPETNVSDFVKVEGGNLTDSYFEVDSEVDSEDDSDLVDEDPLEG
ncbi:hypothetical protein ACHAQJ_004129 [Trichoderma viride]